MAISFLQGLKAKYDASEYKEGVYFATDTLEIIVDDKVYGGNISSVEWDQDTDTLTITLTNGDTQTVTIPAASSENDGLLSKEDKAKLDEITSTVYTGKEAIDVTDGVVSLVIEDEEKVLSQSESGLKTTLGVNYDSDTKMVQLTGIDGEVVSQFDATEFIYDGIIKDVALVTENPETGKTGEFIKITFYTKPDETGEMGTQDIYLDVTDLTDVYVAGNGINIEAGSDGAYTVSVKVSDSSEDYLTVTDDGVSVNGVDEAISTAVEEEKTRAEEAESALEEAIESVKEEASAAHTVVTTDDSALHLTLSTEVDASTGATIYSLGEEDIASASYLGTLEDSTDAGTVCAQVNQNKEDVATALNALEWIYVE